MKKIAVVATEKEYADFLMKDIVKYLSRYADFKSYSIDEVDKVELLTEDFVLLSAFNIFQKVRQKISTNSEIIVLSLSLNKKQMASLQDIPKGTKALLVNFDNRTCMHTITSMYDAGFRDIELFPFSGVEDYDKSINLAITPNEAELVPDGIEQVIDVGESSVDMNSLYNIAYKLGVYDEFSSKEAILARNEYYYINSSMDKLIEEKENFMERLVALIRLMNEGIIITDVVGRIYLNNPKASQLMSFRTKVLRGFNISELLPEINVKNHEEQLIKSETINLIVNSVEINTINEIAGYIITLSDFEEVEAKQHGIRSELSETLHSARFTFKDIIGNSTRIRKTITASKQIARADSSVLITGESGTGKEMFAQSIHNESQRKNYNFVAVNCAAIPENLLESEMFGYEEGSFTGAKKGGRIGYFEFAHKGTIFLDEIGEMPVSLQSKLLRVLEEKKIRKVGSNKNIDVDVRIISATNKNLYEMIESGRFREDLYYRLNVLPLELPSLRERKEDIKQLFSYFIDVIGGNFTLTKEAEKVITNYSWRGNIRELRNVVEFLASKEKRIIEKEDLPFLNYLSPKNVRENKNKNIKLSPKSQDSIMERFILKEGQNIELYHGILIVMEEEDSNQKRCGRKKAQELLLEKDLLYTEAEIRTAMSKLNEFGFIRVGKGRSGSCITMLGKELIEYMESKIGFIGY